MADGYIRRNTGPGRWLRKIPGPVYGLAGASVATLAWALALFL